MYEEVGKQAADLRKTTAAGNEELAEHDEYLKTFFARIRRDCSPGENRS